MQYWSDELNRKFATVEELEVAEAEYTRQLTEAKERRAAEHKRQLLLAEEKQKRYAEVCAAYKVADKLKEAYIADYYSKQGSLLDWLFEF